MMEERLAQAVLSSPAGTLTISMPMVNKIGLRDTLLLSYLYNVSQKYGRFVPKCTDCEGNICRNMNWVRVPMAYFSNGFHFCSYHTLERSIKRLVKNQFIAVRRPTQYGTDCYNCFGVNETKFLEYLR